MTIVDMLEQSGVLTLLGMGTVFGFLIILVFAVMLVGKIIHALGLDKEDEPAKPKVQSAKPANDANVIAAITSAVTEYRKGN